MSDDLIDEQIVSTFCHARLGDHLHAKRVRSIAHGVLGVLHGDDLSVAAVGRGAARARGTSPKHGIKQVDRFLSNDGVAMDKVFAGWVPWLVGDRDSIVVAMDWTEHDHDDQSTIAIYLVTRHGRAAPLVWLTVTKSTLAGRRNAYEDELLLMLYRALPADVQVTLLADRGFGDTAFYAGLHELGFDFVVRFRGCIHMSLPGEESRPTSEFLASDGSARRYDGVSLTKEACYVPGVVTVHDRGMADPWYLATSLRGSAESIVKLYGRRFSIEETFRDTKDIHFGMGLSATHISRPDRRDRLLLLAAIAHVLLTLLGHAGEEMGLDKQLRANTSKKRTHSLYRQGREYIRGAFRRLAGQLRRAFMTLINPQVSRIYTLGVI
jgi:hypothetical protein